MDKLSNGPRRETEIPVDLLASLLIEQANAASKPADEPGRLPAKIYAVMAVTSVATFATLTTGYQLLFSHQLFA